MLDYNIDSFAIKKGFGLSSLSDGYSAARQAAKKALNMIGTKPIISFVFYAGDYDVYEINKALKEVLGHSEFIGGSTDAVFYEDKILRKGILVVSIFSPLLNVGVASSENISSNPFNVARNTMGESAKKIKIDSNINPLIQFKRMKKGHIESLLKFPAFYAFVFSRGFKFPHVGNEVDIIKGIEDVIGQYIPLMGGSLGNDLNKIFRQEKYNIYTLHSGKVMKDGIITVLFNTGLAYANSIAHGCQPTPVIGTITGVEKKGYVVSGISGKKPVVWYAEKLGISKQEFIKKQQYYTQKYPLGISDGYGSFVMRAGGNPYPGDKMSYVAPLVKGAPVFLMDVVTKKLGTAIDELKQDIDNNLHGLDPSLCFAVICASRRAILKDKASQDLRKIKTLFNGPLFGFYSFGEIGSKNGQICRFNHLCVNLFNYYDTPLNELDGV